jgi:hypothetical protein
VFSVRSLRGGLGHHSSFRLQLPMWLHSPRRLCPRAHLLRLDADRLYLGLFTLGLLCQSLGLARLGHSPISLDRLALVLDTGPSFFAPSATPLPSSDPRQSRESTRVATVLWSVLTSLGWSHSSVRLFDPQLLAHAHWAIRYPPP